MINLPNLITSVRFASAILLIWLCAVDPHHGTNYFLALFVAAGISDMLDGFVARRFNLCTEFGAKFDSVSDLLLYSAVLLFLYINVNNILKRYSFLLLCAGAIQLLHMLFALYRHGQYPAYHTNFARLFAYLLFFGIVAFWLFKLPVILPFLILACIASSSEGIVITAILRQPRSNIPSIAEAIALETKIR